MMYFTQTLQWSVKKSQTHVLWRLFIHSLREQSRRQGGIFMNVAHVPSIKLVYESKIEVIVDG
jgi:hypothetical protein